MRFGVNSESSDLTGIRTGLGERVGNLSLIGVLLPVFPPLRLAVRLTFFFSESDSETLPLDRFGLRFFDLRFLGLLFL